MWSLIACLPATASTPTLINARTLISFMFSIGPDAAKGNHCKHIVRACAQWQPVKSHISLQSVVCLPQSTGRPKRFFTVLPKVRAIKSLPSSPLTSIYRALLTSELQSIFDAAPKNPSSIASTRIRELYAQATGAAPPRKSLPPSYWRLFFPNVMFNSQR